MQKILKTPQKKNLLELINKFSKFAEQKFNIKKLLHFYTLIKKLPEREIKKTMPFATAQKRIKYVGINLTQEVRDIYTKDSKTLM